MSAAGVLENMVMVFGQMNEPPGARFRVGHSTLTMAEYFRDDEIRDVLLLIDNIFRFIQAGMEVSGLMGQMPARLGYQPTMGTELSQLEERIANTDTGAITSIQAVYVPADDFTDPAAVHTFSHLSASIVLSRKRANEGLYPTIDPLQSSSKWPRPGSSARGTMLWHRRSAAPSHNMQNSRTLLPCWLEIAQRVSAAVSQWLNDAFQLVTDVLALNQSVLKDAARQLLVQETLDDQCCR